MSARLVIVRYNVSNWLIRTSEERMIARYKSPLLGWRQSLAVEPGDLVRVAGLQRQQLEGEDREVVGPVFGNDTHILGSLGHSRFISNQLEGPVFCALRQLDGFGLDVNI